jgi:Tfp pilus assembly protein PilO
MEAKINIFSSNSSLFSYLDKQRQNRQTIQTFEVVATLLTVSFFILFAIYPAVSTISSLITEISSKKTVSSKLRLKINQVVIAQDTFSKIQQRYQVIDSALPDQPRFTQLAAQVQNMGQVAGVDTQAISFGISKIGSTASTISLNFGQAVSYSSIIEFIHQLKSNRRLFNINSIKLSQVEDKTPENSSNLINFSLGTDALYWSKNSLK